MTEPKIVVAVSNPVVSPQFTAELMTEGLDWVEFHRHAGTCLFDVLFGEDRDTAMAATERAVERFQSKHPGESLRVTDNLDT